MEYKEKIIKMVNEIDCEDYIMKIYFYVLARYKKYKEKSRKKFNSPGFYIFLPYPWRSFLMHFCYLRPIPYIR